MAFFQVDHKLLQKMRKPSIWPQDNITCVNSGQSMPTCDVINKKNGSHSKTKQFSVKDSTGT